MPTIESDIPTDPGAPTAYQARVMQEARSLLGQHEEGGDNWGNVVLTVATPFIGPERLATFAPGGTRAGKLLWCALTVSFCWWRAWSGFKPYADSECSDLWEKLAEQGWTWVKDSDAGEVSTIEGNAGDEVRERSYHMSEAQVYGFARPMPDRLGAAVLSAPEMADIIFFVNVDRRGRQKFKRDGRPDFRHVGLVQRFLP